MIELNKMTAIEAKLDAIIYRMNNQKRINHSVNEVETINGVGHNRIADQGLS